MIKLIIIEISKILKHKSIYFIFLLIFLFCFFNNFLFRLDYDSDGRYKYTEDINVGKEIVRLNKELNNYDVNNEKDKNIYISTKSLKDVYSDMLRFDKNSWQYIKYNDYMYDIIYNMNYYMYVIKDKDKLKEYSDKYNKYVSYFKDNNYKYFICEEKKVLDSKIKDIENKIKVTSDKELSGILNIDLTKYKNELLIINYRLSNNISYSNTYLNRALIEYEEGISKRDEYKNRKVEFNDQVKYNQIISKIYVNKYIIDNKVNVLKINSLNNQLRDITLDYELFIIIIILISIGILFGDEFSSGTIKLLLIKPYKRSSILFSKIIACFMMILITILFLIICELLLGGIILGFDSLKDIVAVYNFNSNKIIEYNIFIYMFFNIISRMPMFLFVLLLGILINNLSNNIISFSISFIIFSFSTVINNLIINNNIRLLKYLFTLNWNYTNYLFGGIGDFKYLSLKNSIFIYIIYVIILLVIMTYYFNRKDIKNV